LREERVATKKEIENILLLLMDAIPQAGLLHHCSVIGNVVDVILDFRCRIDHILDVFQR
jgi:hypothetical protein